MIRKHIWGILSAICFIIAIGLLGIEPLKTHLINSYQPRITRSTIDQSQNKPKNYNFNSVHPVTMKDAIKARANSKNVSIAGQMLVLRVRCWFHQRASMFRLMRESVGTPCY